MNGFSLSVCSFPSPFFGFSQCLSQVSAGCQGITYNSIQRVLLAWETYLHDLLHFALALSLSRLSPALPAPRLSQTPLSYLSRFVFFSSLSRSLLVPSISLQSTLDLSTFTPVSLTVVNTIYCSLLSGLLIEVGSRPTPQPPSLGS